MECALSAWVVPRGNVSALSYLIEGAQGYREHGDRWVTGPVVPMPLRAEHVLDLGADLLVYADAGALVTVVGLGGDGRAPRPTVTSRIPLPASLEVRSLALRAGVVLVGGRGKRDVLGTVDLHAGARFRPLGLELVPDERYHGVERLVLSGDRLLVIGDVPLHVLDVADPRAPRLAEAHLTRLLDPLPFSVAATSRFVVTATPVASDTGAMLKILDLARQTTVVWHSGLDPRIGAIGEVALAGDTLLLAAGKWGLGAVPVSRVQPAPAGRVSRAGGVVMGRPEPWSAGVRFFPVQRGGVVGVVPVDATRAFAVTESTRGLDSVLVGIA